MKAILNSTLLMLFLASCTSSDKLSYLNNLSETGGDQKFAMEIPTYRIQPRDVLYITVKAITVDGSIIDFLSPTRGIGNSYVTQGESGGYIYGYDVNPDGNIILPAIGILKVSDLTVDEARNIIQAAADKVYKNSTVECKLLSFKFTVIGEVKIPGTYINYNNYLTVLEAIGRAGGVNEFGNRSRILVVRPDSSGTTAYSINLQDKELLSSPAYFLLPNDVVIVQPMKNKAFSLNLPSFTFIVTSVTSLITTSILLINYFK